MIIGEKLQSPLISTEESIAIMPIFANLVRWSAIFSLLAISAGCTSSPKATAPQATTSPTTAASPEPIITPIPTASANGTKAETTPQALPTAPGKILPVEINQLEAFKHPSGLFSINIPQGWKKQENSQPNQLVTVWVNPPSKSLLLLNIIKVTSKVPPEVLGKQLQELLQKEFAQQTNLKVSEPNPQSNGRISVELSYQEQAGGNSITVVGNSFIEQQNDKISILYVGYPKLEGGNAQAKLNEVANSYKIDPAGQLP